MLNDSIKLQRYIKVMSQYVDLDLLDLEFNPTALRKWPKQA